LGEFTVLSLLHSGVGSYSLSKTHLFLVEAGHLRIQSSLKLDKSNKVIASQYLIKPA